LSIDPLVAQTGQPYVFANDNPLNATDPLGWYAASAGGGGFIPVVTTPGTGTTTVTVNGPTLFTASPFGTYRVTSYVSATCPGNSYSDVSVNLSNVQVVADVNGQIAGFNIQGASSMTGVTSGSIGATEGPTLSVDGTTTLTWTFNVNGVKVAVVVSIKYSPNSTSVTQTSDVNDTVTTMAALSGAVSDLILQYWLAPLNGPVLEYDG